LTTSGAKGHNSRMTQLNSICIYCGSGNGADPAFARAAGELGRILAAENIRLVYGGGSLGLMGVVARAVLDNGGRALGIIPQFLVDREAMLEELSELVVTADMHERKRLMFEAADAFVALPGGIGTLEEVVEQMTWAQLGRHKKPILLADINGFWTPLIQLLQHMNHSAFIRPGFALSYGVAHEIGEVLPKIRKRLAQLTETSSAGGVPLDKM
jgi:uncharacterized protein (TIGR00730 family)